MSSPTPSPAYSFSPRVLQRWARRNLQIERDDQGEIAAVFRFHGSTCGNIEFDLLYHVRVAAADDGLRLQSLHCEPASREQGHTHMCCWLHDAESVAAVMRDEAPLHGRPLSDVLDWQPASSPSGCLCSEDARLHKWNAVLQTLHFALTSSPLADENRTR